MGRRLRVIVVWSVLAGIFAGCGPDATDLSTCENARFKQRLCAVNEYPVAGVCGGALADAERCRAECWYDAPCEDLAVNEASPDVQDCINECVATDGRFTCEDGHEIPASWVCDGNLDCGDGDTSDEDC